jgi:CRP-like cAMP-binding protein
MTHGVKKPSNLSLQHLVKLLPASRQKHFKAGTIILRENSRAECCYLILKGRVEISKKLRHGRVFKVAEVKPGDFFGEMGMLSGLKRTASVHALTNVDALALTREDFETLLKIDPALGTLLALHFSRTLATRCARILEHLGRSSAGGSKRKMKVNFSSVLNGVYALMAV